MIDEREGVEGDGIRTAARRGGVTVWRLPPFVWR